jgi:hypothetical protein
MRKILLLLTVLLLCVSVFFAACDKSGDDESKETESESSEVSKSESSVPEQESSAPEVSKPSPDEDGDDHKPEADSPIKILSCTYTEKPYFAVIGKCADGAVVTGTANGTTVSSNSYKGWFSLRLPCNGSTVSLTLTQTVNGAQVGESLKYNAAPSTPYRGAWPLISGGDYQFFLQKMIDDYNGSTVNNANVYSELTDRIKDRLEQLRGYNPDAEIIYLIAPSAMTVYSDLLPEEYKSTPASQTNLDLVVDAINASGATAIDLKEVFAEHKNDELPLYYKLDSHWADYGAFIAYDSLFDHISQKFPAAAPKSVDEFNWNGNYYEGGDIAYYLSKNEANAPLMQSKIREFAYYRTFKDTGVPTSITSVPRYRSSTMLCYDVDAMTPERKISTGRSDLPSCIVMRDSYSTQIYDLIAERMDTTHFLAMWDYGWNTRRIAQEKPDYMIYVISEWNINELINNG